MNIKIKNVEFDGTSFQVPKGLNELLNNGDCWKKKEDFNDGYQRKLFVKDGRLFTSIKKEGDKE